MDWRAWITVPGVSRDEEDSWEPFVEALERDHAVLGPVLSWDDTGAAVVIVSMDIADRAGASELAVASVVDALRASGHGDRYPTGVEVEAIVEDDDGR